MPTPLLSNFTPSLMSPETLEQIFVQREDIAQDLVDRIILSATTPAKHYSLLIGARGMGKTHLVSLVYYRLQQHQELADKLMVAWLREDEWGIDSWLDLVVRIFRALGETKVDTQGLLAQLQQVSISDAQTLATQLLTELIGNKTLLLIIENLDDLFAGLGERGQQNFRSFLQERQCCTILATTPALFAGVQNRSEPFFGFFNPIPLSPLSWEEATVMLQKIAELDGQADLANFLQTPAGKARVRAVHHLAGGNPRVYTLFAQFITRESLDELVQAFMKMLDDLTPYYQSRMKELSNQQRKIIEFLVDRREAVMVKEIATQCFIEQRVVSGQLRELRNKGYVVARANGRESFYELTEVLMRLCMEVKKYRGQWVELFVDFLRIWYRPAERQERLAMLRGNGGLISDEHLEFALASDADPVLLVVSREFQHSLAQKDRNLAVQVLTELQAIGGMGADRCQEIRELVNAGKFDEVREILDRNVAPDSNNAESLYLEGLMLCVSEKWSEALVLLDRVLEIDTDSTKPTLRERAEAFYTRGYVLDELGKYPEAIASYDRAIEFKPDYHQAWYNRGISLANLGKYPEAIASYDRAIEFKPDKHEAWSNRGNSLANLGKYPEAIASYDRAIEFKPDDHQAWYNRGNSLDNLGKYPEAIASYDRAIEFKPDKHEAWSNRGNSLANLGKYPEAIASYDRAIEFKPDDHQAWYNRGNSLDNLGKYPEAIASYDRAIEFKPDDHQAWYNRGNSLDNLGKYPEAIASYDRAIEFKPDKHEAWSNRGNSLANLGKYPEAIASYDRAIEFKPDDHQAWYNRGNSLDNLGKYPEAIASYDRAIEFKPDKHEAWYNRGNSLANLGKYPEAIASYDRAIEFKPDKHEAWSNRGVSLDNLGKYPEAIASYDRAIEFKPDKHEAWSNRGNSLANLGKYPEAIASYDRAIEFKPDKHEAWYNRGISLANLGKYPEAIASYDRAIEFKPDEYDSVHNKGIALFSMGNYSAALTTWHQTFNIIHQTIDRPYDVAGLIQEFIEALIPKFTQPAVQNMLIELVQTYSQTSVLTELGTALVRTLKQILAADISDDTAQKWLELWQELLGERSEMQLPFRLMKTAILYKQHPEQKERLWLGLASEERAILDEALA